MAGFLYLETSAALRAILETGTTPELERRIALASHLLTSRLTLIESARAVLRLRARGISELEISRAEQALEELWARCEIWELTPAVCDFASQVAPTRPLRTLDALHLATFLLARRRLGEVELMSADRRLLDRAGLS